MRHWRTKLPPLDSASICICQVKNIGTRILQFLIPFLKDISLFTLYFFSFSWRDGLRWNCTNFAETVRIHTNPYFFIRNLQTIQALKQKSNPKQSYHCHTKNTVLTTCAKVALRAASDWIGSTIYNRILM